MPSTTHRLAATAFLLLAASTAAPVAQAAIEWQTKIVKLAPALFSGDVEAVFPFKNTGDIPVTIVNTTASCGCTIPALAKQTYAPGESGELRAKYNIGERTGSQHSTITVQTNTPGEGFIKLELALQIPEPVALNPRVVSWNVGEAAEPKRISVKFHPETGWKPTSVATDAAGWKCELKAADAPHEYWIEVTPPTTESRGRAIFGLVTDAPGNKRYSLFAFVR